MPLDDPISEHCTKPVLRISRDETIATLISEMVSNRFRRFPVTTSDNQIVGIVSATDVITVAYQEGTPEFLNSTVETIMSDDIVVVHTNDTVRETIHTMYNVGISGVPVVEDNKIKGIFTDKDIILRDKLWEDIEDTLVTPETGIGRPIDKDITITTDYNLWQVTDKLANTATRQLLIRDAEMDNITGILTAMELNKSMLNVLDEDGAQLFNYLQETPITEIELRPLFQKGTPALISSLRLWMNSRGVEAFPLYHRNKPIKLITEKDIVAYMASIL